MDQIEEEQDNNFKISSQKRALEADLAELKANYEIAESNVKNVCIFFKRHLHIITRNKKSLLF